MSTNNKMASKDDTEMSSSSGASADTLSDYQAGVEDNFIAGIPVTTRNSHEENTDLSSSPKAKKRKLGKLLFS